MAKYYWNSEFDKVESIEEIHDNYYLPFGRDFESFDDYLVACSWRNNGALHTVQERLSDVKRRLDNALESARAYGWTEYMEEITELMADMHRLSQYARDRA